MSRLLGRMSGGGGSTGNGGQPRASLAEDELVQQLRNDLQRLRLSDGGDSEASSLHLDHNAAPRRFAWDPPRASASVPSALASSVPVQLQHSASSVSDFRRSQQRSAPPVGVPPGGGVLQHYPQSMAGEMIGYNHANGGGGGPSSGSYSNHQVVVDNYNQAPSSASSSSSRQERTRRNVALQVDRELDGFANEIDRKFYQDPRKRGRAAEQIAGFLTGPWSQNQIHYQPNPGGVNNNSEGGISYGTLDDESLPRKLALGGKNSLTNMGNTCFMNTGLQCMAHLDPVVAFFLSSKFKYELNFEAKHGSKDATITIGFAEILLRLWSSPSYLNEKQEKKLAKSGANGGQGANDEESRFGLKTTIMNTAKRIHQTMSVNAKRANSEMTIFVRPNVQSYVEYKPQRYLKKLAAHNKDLFRENIEQQEEQDVQEFISWLLDMLQEDTNLVDNATSALNKKRSSNVAPVSRDFRAEDLLAIEREFGSESAAALCWARSLSMYRGFIVDCFQGQWRSTVTCNRCKNFSRSYERFLMTSLPLSRSGATDSVTLMEALRAFSQEEQLGENEKWYCPTCKRKEQATKKIEFWKLPYVLILHLKRFEFDQYRNRWNKNCARMKSPLSLDLAEFEAPGNGKPNPTPLHYDVICSANHVGNDLETGHYTATCRHPINKTFYYFDDDDVTKDREENVVSESSYVLFLMRRAPNGGTLPRQDLAHPENWPHKLHPEFLRVFPSVFDRLCANAETQAQKDAQSRR
ncbi:unnamed protein product [Amoebophrya sp. A120]|nr:unnamed protein product [Amoebophrya sp. A120]|eukprot:GSA120T00012984001.1